MFDVFSFEFVIDFKVFFLGCFLFVNKGLFFLLIDVDFIVSIMDVCNWVGLDKRYLRWGILVGFGDVGVVIWEYSFELVDFWGFWWCFRLSVLGCNGVVCLWWVLFVGFCGLDELLDIVFLRLE